MIVPRGTPVTAPGSWVPKRLTVPREFRTALRAGAKTTMRFAVDAENSIVHPGTFDGLDLDTGRARRSEVPQLKARCVFTSGKARSVTVMPTFGRGDLLWIVGRVTTPRTASTLTLEVLGVDVKRLQDMTDDDAVREGAAMLPNPQRRLTPPPRMRFAEFWEQRHGARAWANNPWVWIVRFKVHHEQVDELLDRWGHDERRP